MLGVIEDTRIRITGNQAVGSKKGQGLNHGRHFSGVVGVSFGTCQARGGSVVMTGPNMTSILPWGDRATAHHPASVSPFGKASTSISVDGPSLKVITAFTCCGTTVGEV